MIPVSVTGTVFDVGFSSSSSLFLYSPKPPPQLPHPIWTELGKEGSIASVQDGLGVAISAVLAGISHRLSPTDTPALAPVGRREESVPWRNGGAELMAAIRLGVERRVEQSCPGSPELT